MNKEVLEYLLAKSLPDNSVLFHTRLERKGSIVTKQIEVSYLILATYYLKAE